ncbi:MAG: YicC family protein [Alicyclobacillus sp.]|nr:YicC family protein [Alicyclobacillus sp.]
MALSMTGFGRGTFASESFTIRAEVRAVNHRFLEISFHLPRGLMRFEDRLRRMVGAHLGRGKIDVTLHLGILAPGLVRVRFDAGLAMAYREALLALADGCRLPGELTLEHFLRLPDLFTVDYEGLDEGSLWAGLSAALEEALRELTAMRRAEGERLAADLLARVALIEGFVAAIEERAPAVPDYYRTQLAKRIEEILGRPGIDETRLAQEVALFAERCNITEEIVRLRSHLGQLRGTLVTEGAFGRKADFILQEINRELNTIGAKANDLTIARAVIEAKAELEKVREQVQNLE